MSFASMLSLLGTILALIAVAILIVMVINGNSPSVVDLSVVAVALLLASREPTVR